jgi:MFS family permease
MAMVGLDTAIVNVAMPSIQHDLGMSRGALQWVVVSYGLLLGGFLLVGGRMADHLGRRRMFLTGLGVFTAASLAAGAAHAPAVLIAARAVQGFGAALIVPAALSLLAVTFPEGPARSRALGIFGAVGGAAGSVGVVASGLLTGGPGWRWAFLINVPAGVAFMVIAAVFLGADRADGRTSRLNLAGPVTVTAGLLLLIYSFHHPMWLPVAAALLALFVWTERRSEAPLVPAAILRNRPLVAANITAFLANCALMSFIFIGSLLMQQGLGYSRSRQDWPGWPRRPSCSWRRSPAAGWPSSSCGG